MSREEQKDIAAKILTVLEGWTGQAEGGGAGAAEGTVGIVAG